MQPVITFLDFRTILPLVNRVEQSFAGAIDLPSRSQLHFCGHGIRFWWERMGYSSRFLHRRTAHCFASWPTDESKGR